MSHLVDLPPLSWYENRYDVPSDVHTLISPAPVINILPEKMVTGANEKPETGQPRKAIG
jgi:hypothetical protein